MTSGKLFTPTGVERNLLIVVLIESRRGEISLGIEAFFKEFSWNSSP